MGVCSMGLMSEEGKKGLLLVIVNLLLLSWCIKQSRVGLIMINNNAFVICTQSQRWSALVCNWGGVFRDASGSI